MMNHVLENCLIVAVLIAIILIPVRLSILRSRKRKKQKIDNELKAAEKDKDLCFQHIDQLDAFVIALDPVKKKLIQMGQADYQIDLIDLREIVSCVLEEKKQGDTLQLLQLGLRDKNQKASHIVFYKQYQHNEWHLKKTIRMAAKWKLLIQDTIRQAA
ncbi:MAG: hypothetical protein V4592_03710 [Bacteroidota bacterium]